MTKFTEAQLEAGRTVPALKSGLPKYQIFFVKDGLLNGEDGVHATTCGFGVQYPDGWYWLSDTDEDDNTDGHGPWSDKEKAEKAAQIGLTGPFR